MPKQRGGGKKKHNARGASEPAAPASSTARANRVPHKLIILFRHGESLAQTTSDKKRRMTDPAMRDAGLSSKGKRDAQKLAQDEVISQGPFQLIVCSPLTRSLQTCCLSLKERRDVPIVCHPGLKEFGRRSLTGAENTGRPLSELREDGELTALPRFHEIDFSHVDPQWESAKAACKWWEPPALEADRSVRLLNFRRWLLLRPERVVCITAHGQVFQELLGTQQRMVNCKLMAAAMDSDGSMQLLEHATGTAPTLALMRSVGQLPVLADRTESLGKRAKPRGQASAGASSGCGGGAGGAAAAAAAAAAAGGGGGGAGGGGEKKLSRREQKQLKAQRDRSSKKCGAAPKFVLLAGLPGSGKSTFVNALLHRHGSTRRAEVPAEAGCKGDRGRLEVSVVGLPWAVLVDVKSRSATVHQVKASVAKVTGLRTSDIILSREPSHEASLVAPDDAPVAPSGERFVTLYAQLTPLSKRDFSGATRRVVEGDGPAKEWVCISQDVVSSSGLTQELLPVYAKKSNRRVIFDNCNVDARSRRTACEIAMVAPSAAHVVYFDTPVEECVERVNGREWHPTIRQGSGGGVVRSKAKRLEPPSPAEGFASIHVVRSLEDVSALSQSWGGAEATLSSAVARIAEEEATVEVEQQEQVMASAHLPEALQDVAAAGGLAAKNAEHYFGNLDPSKILMVRQRSDPVHMGDPEDDDGPEQSEEL